MKKCWKVYCKSVNGGETKFSIRVEGIKGEIVLPKWKYKQISLSNSYVTLVHRSNGLNVDRIFNLGPKVEKIIPVNLNLN